MILKSNINLYSPKSGEINRFLTSFYNKEIQLPDDSKYNISFENPVEMTDLIGTYIENKEKYKINMWISIDKNIYIKLIYKLISFMIKLAILETSSLQSDSTHLSIIANTP